MSLESPRQLRQHHRRGDQVLALGRPDVAPPVYCNIALTTRCNLRCTICGSQNIPDMQQREMPLDVFRRVADVIFPFMSVVELNSWGEPLLYPHIADVLEAIARHGCRMRLQSNATLLTPRVSERLASQSGELQLSIDATGRLFEQLRVGAHWDRVAAGVGRLVAACNRDELHVWLTPTVTRRSLPDLVPLLDWAAEIGLYGVNYRRYHPVPGLVEERPGDEEMAPVVEQIRERCERGRLPMTVMVDNEWIITRGRPWPARPGRAGTSYGNYPVPRRRSWSHPDYVCVAPLQYVEIGFDGEMFLCCRTQLGPKLGDATSLEAFAGAWFGEQYGAIRDSLRHDASAPRAIPQCDACVAAHV